MSHSRALAELRKSVVLGRRPSRKNQDLTPVPGAQGPMAAVHSDEVNDMTWGPTLEPLRDIEIQTTVGDVVVTGMITRLWPNGMLVVITSPLAGWGSDLHVPAFAMAPCNWLATYRNDRTVAITARGQQKAEDLLQTIYLHVHGGASGWSVYRVGELPRME